MPFIERVFEQVGGQLTSGPVQADLRRLCDAVEIIDVELRIGRHRDRVQAGALREAFDLAGILSVERSSIELPLDGIGFGRGEIHQAPIFVDGLDGAAPKVIHVPVAGRQLLEDMPLIVVQIEVARTHPAADRPDELGGSLEEREFVVKLDPRRAGFGQDHMAATGLDVRE